MTLKNNRAPSLCYFKHCASFHSHWWIQTGVKSPETPNLGQIRRLLESCDLEIWRRTLKNKRAPPLCYFKPCASFRSHWWIQAGVRVRKRPVCVKIDVFLSCVTLKFNRWPGKKLGTSSMLLQALCIISKPSVNSNWSYSPVTPNLGQNQRFFVPCDLQIWQMTLKNNRAPLLSNIKF